MLNRSNTSNQIIKQGKPKSLLNLNSDFLLFDMLLSNSNASIVYGEEKYSFSQLIELIERYSQYFTSIGIESFSKVMLAVKDPMSFVLSMLALIKLNAIPMPVYSQTGCDRLYQTLCEFDINYIIADNNLTDMEQYDLCSCGEFEGTRVYSYSEALDNSLSDVSLILFTSGTTSVPKAIMLTKRNIMSNVIAISQYLCLSSDDSMLLIKNLNHSSTIIGELFVGLYNGCKIVFTKKLPTVKNICNIIDGQQISVFFSVPTILKEILLFNNQKTVNLESLRIINFYGAPIPFEDLQSLINIFPSVNFIYSYGQTEASPRVTYIERKHLETHIGSSGKCISGVSLRIADENGKTVANGVRGEIVVSGPNVMYGYYKNPELTAKTVRQGELYTGDMGYVDEDGFLYVCGRSDNMIISAGKNIYPEEIEGVLSSYKDIVEAFVSTHRQDNHTVKLIGYIVSDNWDSIDKKDFVAFCRRNLENYKIPSEIYVVPALKRTPNGKISREQHFEALKNDEIVKFI